jgi:hypothetical protein
MEIARLTLSLSQSFVQIAPYKPISIILTDIVLDAQRVPFLPNENGFENKVLELVLRQT